MLANIRFAVLLSNKILFDEKYEIPFASKNDYAGENIIFLLVVKSLVIQPGIN